jgi:2-iminoacetate synthase ThiH
MKKFRVDKILEMLATIQFRILQLSISHLKALKIKTYETTILPLVLYGCETWSITLMEEHRSRISENKRKREVEAGE